MTIQGAVSHGGTQLLTRLLTRSNASKYALGWLGLGSYVQPPVIPPSLPQPEFFIGSKVADHWVDEFEDDCVEYGVVCGIVWHPRQQEWGYLIDWQKGQGPDWLYPCFDGHLVIGGDLRSADND